MEPRRPVKNNTSFIWDSSNQVSEESVRERFCYGIKRLTCDETEIGNIKSLTSSINKNPKHQLILVRIQSKENMAEYVPGKFSYGLKFIKPRELCQL